MDVEHTGFILAHTRVAPAPLAPEVLLRLADPDDPFWDQSLEAIEDSGFAMPWWAFVWAGGGALARFLLDHPRLVRGKRVMAFAAGSGVEAIAAALAGATEVVATELCELAACAIQRNAQLNEVRVEVRLEDVVENGAPDCDLLLVGDGAYEEGLAARVWAWIAAASNAGVQVLVGDPDRGFLPPDLLTRVAGYGIEAPGRLEDPALRNVAVYRI